MDPFLAQLYGTQASVEAEKVASAQDIDPAQVELFTKAAAAHGIDLTQLAPEQVEQLWDASFSKLAESAAKHEAGETKSEEAKEEAEEDDKDEAEKKAYAEWFEVQDQAGRIMAHAFHQESQKIAASMSEKAKNLGGYIKDKGKAIGKHVGEAFGSAERAVGKHVGEAFGSAERAAAKGLKEEAAGAPNSPYGDTKLRDAVKQQIAGRNKALKSSAILGGGALAATGAGVGIHHALKEKKKEGSLENLNEAAIELALDKVAAAGWNAEEAVERLGAVFTLTGVDGPQDLSKIASADDVETAVEIRSLQLLESAGYPVTWNV
ncbi:MAG: hypothetical protein WCP53_09295 [Verrucomicrobiota bacterium]